MLEKISDIETGQDFSVGNDIVFLPDFEKTFNELFKQKVYSKQEMNYCDQFDQPILRYASTWAAKEAVYKAVKQLDPLPIAFKKIGIFREKIAGRPYVKLPGNLEHLPVSLTITHDGDYVWAVALINVSGT
ncbi:MAG: holo-ACP synthase [Pedobacter sp.]|nr:MAG: holo-ACP synthase [Pedobacter sp.]